MQQDIISIQSPSDLSQAMRSSQEKIKVMGDQLKVETRELPRTMGKVALRKSIPFLVGAGTIVLGALLLRQWMRRSKGVSAKPMQEIEPAASPMNMGKAVAIQLLPVALQLFKKWLIQRKSNTNHQAQQPIQMEKQGC